ncbi:hypothetical protein EYF80_020318 [Liparis tanakae]|uniref:Uncharacterized protein n=1 Tax=Liparis tanakae TaxID=230148 RepID=A0A4Z2HWT9_9TELE|nr:hypothetical protein EYF80_020318 [Liparis tanakae]
MMSVIFRSLSSSRCGSPLGRHYTSADPEPGGAKGRLVHPRHLVQAHDAVDWWGDEESGVVDNAEVGLVFELAGLLELGVCALLLDQLFYKGLVRGLGEPALFIQQSQHSWGVCLMEYQHHKLQRQ